MSYDQWDILVRAAAVVATVVGLAVPGGWRRRVLPLAHRPWAAAGVVAAISLAVNLAVAARQGMPRPRVHDEFAYLLAADTFAHGRVTNPTPAAADRLQSPHVLVRPTYVAKYPPAQGVALAVGQVLGRPIYGVWMSAALAAVAVAWMAAAFAGPEWALLAGLVAAVHPQLVDWGHVFWGGSVAVIGGALVVGAWGRLMSSARASAAGGFADQRPPIRKAASGGAWRAAIVLGVGLVVLANSRPFEGLVLALPLSVALIPRWRRLGPTLAVVLVGAALTGAYNHRVTGRVLRLPFAEYAGQFDVYPKFWFLPQRSPTPAYPNATMAEVHTVKERGRFDLLQTDRGRIATAVEWARRLWQMHARPTVLVIPLVVGLCLCARPTRLPTSAGSGCRPSYDRRVLWLAVTVVVFLLGLTAENWFLPHYAAPVVPAVLLLAVLGWRRLAEWDGPGGPFARRLGRGVAVGFFVAAGLSALAPADPDLTRFTRDDLLAETPALRSGRHVVFVRYAADHPVEDEWAYNGADPAGQAVVWAHSLDPAADAAVQAAWGPRRAWVLTVGRTTHTLAPLPVN